jgi:hypothetical protein
MEPSHAVFHGKHEERVLPNDAAMVPIPAVSNQYISQVATFLSAIFLDTSGY